MGCQDKGNGQEKENTGRLLLPVGKSQTKTRRSRGQEKMEAGGRGRTRCGCKREDDFQPAGGFLDFLRRIMQESGQSSSEDEDGREALGADGLRLHGEPESLLTPALRLWRCHSRVGTG